MGSGIIVRRGALSSEGSSSCINVTYGHSWISDTCTCEYCNATIHKISDLCQCQGCQQYFHPASYLEDKVVRYEDSEDWKVTPTKNKHAIFVGCNRCHTPAGTVTYENCSFVESDGTIDTSIQTCSECGATNDGYVSHSHSYTARVEYKSVDNNYHTVTGYCSCGAEGKSTSEEHTITTKRVEPTCTTDGSVTTTCSYCEFSDTDTLPALGHDWQQIDYKAPSCEEIGYESSTCSRCGEPDYIEYPATGHSFYESIEGEFYCQQYTVQYCHNCGYSDQISNAPGCSYVNGQCEYCGSRDPSYCDTCGGPCMSSCGHCGNSDCEECNPGGGYCETHGVWDCHCGG